MSSPVASYSSGTNGSPGREEHNWCRGSQDMSAGRRRLQPGAGKRERQRLHRIRIRLFRARYSLGRPRNAVLRAVAGWRDGWSTETGHWSGHEEHACHIWKWRQGHTRGQAEVDTCSQGYSQPPGNCPDAATPRDFPELEPIRLKFVGKQRVELVYPVKPAFWTLGECVCRFVSCPPTGTAIQSELRSEERLSRPTAWSWIHSSAGKSPSIGRTTTSREAALCSAPTGT